MTAHGLLVVSREVVFFHFAAGFDYKKVMLQIH
jgi:hypothetical protein